LRKIVLFFCICIFLYSCCTKKDCDQENNPVINVGFEGFDNSDRSSFFIYVVDTNSFKPIGSVYFNLYSLSNSLTIYDWMLNDRKIDIQDYNYIIKTNVSSDTIYKIRYEKYNEKVECNTCYPFGDGTATLINFRNFSYYFRQIKYEDKQSLTIKK